ncbi:MAG: ComEC/Rec2 family competence protein [Minisyncoccia bacterium]
MELFKKYLLSLCILVLVFANIFVFQLDWQNSHKGLTFVVLDVGQGDALFIESPTGTQIMFDVGPPRKVLGPLSQVMSPFDKSIDAVVITNPDADHIGGFLDILKTYQVGEVFSSGTISDSKTYKNLETEIKNKNIPNTLVKKGMRLDIGGGAVIDILFPDRDVSAWSTNDGSVVARLSYGNTSIMLTGDATKVTEKIILSENSQNILRSSILKVGHHGSRGSTSLEFAQAVLPLYSLISVGKSNKYGHPHQDALDILKQINSDVFRTDMLGSIVVKSNGDKLKFDF